MRRSLLASLAAAAVGLAALTAPAQAVVTHFVGAVGQTTNHLDYIELDNGKFISASSNQGSIASGLAQSDLAAGKLRAGGNANSSSGTYIGLGSAYFADTVTFVGNFNSGTTKFNFSMNFKGLWFSSGDTWDLGRAFVIIGTGPVPDSSIDLTALPVLFREIDFFGAADGPIIDFDISASVTLSGINPTLYFYTGLRVGGGSGLIANDTGGATPTGNPGGYVANFLNTATMTVGIEDPDGNLIQVLSGSESWPYDAPARPLPVQDGSIPEPSTALASTLAIAGLAFIRRRTA